MDILGPMDIGADGRGHCWGRGGWGLGSKGLSSVDWGWGFEVGGVGDGGRVGVGGWGQGLGLEV